MTQETRELLAETLKHLEAAVDNLDQLRISEVNRWRSKAYLLGKAVELMNMRNDIEEHQDIIFAPLPKFEVPEHLRD